MKILDKYLLRSFVNFLCFSFLIFISIMVVVDAFEKIDIFIDFKTPLDTILRFYVFSLPDIMFLILPVAMLLATILTVGQLAKTNELIAVRSAGVSLTRVLMPVFAFSLVICVAAFLLEELVVPYSSGMNREVMSHEIRKEPRVPLEEKRNINLLTGGGRILAIGRYDIQGKRMENVLVEEFSSDTLRRRIDARVGEWDGKAWVFRNGVIRTFLKGGEQVFQFGELRLRGLREIPSDFAKQEKRPQEMNLLELGKYISMVRQSGGSVQKQLVEFHIKLAFPFANFIVVLIGAALSNRIRRGTVALGGGMGLTISFIYYGFFKTGEALGHSGVLPPVLAAWLGNIFFFILGVFLFSRSQK